MGMFIILTVVKFHKCICVSKLIKEHSKWVQQITVSYASMKQFLKNTYAQPFEGFSLRELSHKSISTHFVCVALSSLFCTFHPSFPQSWRTRCAVWACLLPSFCSFFYYFLEKGEWNLNLHGLDSTLICIQSHAQLAAQLLAWEVGIKTTYSPDTDGGLVQRPRFQLSEVERWESSTDWDTHDSIKGHYLHTSEACRLNPLPHVFSEAGSPLPWIHTVLERHSVRPP